MHDNSSATIVQTVSKHKKEERESVCEREGEEKYICNIDIGRQLESRKE